jgi:hypothetical protein
MALCLVAGLSPFSLSSAFFGSLGSRFTSQIRSCSCRTMSALLYAVRSTVTLMSFMRL